jgi:hypothetical protein
MHSIEPFFLWRDYYTSSEDEDSPFFEREYSEFYFTKKVYNYYIHPQWDDFGSETLYLKILFADYEKKYAIIELIGEWNDTLENDIATLKDFVINPLLEKGINSFILLGENVFNFHGSDDCYYEEWVEEVDERDGFICFVNFLPHVFNEMEHHDIHHHVCMGTVFSGIAWRPMKPNHFYLSIKRKIEEFNNENNYQLEY